MEILFLSLANLAVPVLIILGIVWLVKKSNQKMDRSTSAASQIGWSRSTAERDKMWLEYIAAHLQKAQTKAEKQLLQKMLDENNYLATHDVTPGEANSNLSIGSASTMNATTPNDTQHVTTAKPTTSTKSIDGTLLLLYFGAFLFVASTGLFVAFAGLNGVLRTFLVVFVMAVMYAGGFWLYRQKRLKQAGIAFVAIGMAIAPLVGPALYSFVTNETHASAVWLLTSLLCISMYLYALLKIRNGFIGYLVIFSFLSLFESGVAVVALPIYYLVWGMLAAGMIMKSIGLLRGIWPELTEPADVSSRIIVPFTLFVSVALIVSQGYVQLAVSLFLAAVFYVIEAASSRESRQENIVTAHTLFIMGWGVSAYSIGHSLHGTAAALLVLSAVQLILTLILPRRENSSRNVATLAMVTITVAGALGCTSAPLLLTATCGALIIGASIAFYQRRVDAFNYSALVVISLPIIVGQAIVSNKFNATQQSLSGFLASVVLFGAYILIVKRRTMNNTWRMSARLMYIVACITSLTAAFFANQWLALIVATAIAACFIGIEYVEKSRQWAVSSGLIIALPIFYGIVIYSTGFFFVSVLVALAWNIVVALYYRQETNRWIGALLWLLLPIAFGLGGLGLMLPPEGFAWAYIITMLGLILSRAIALGLVFQSTRVPIASFARNKSLSYSTGYIVAAVIAFIFSTNAHNSHLHVSLIVGTITLTVLLLARYIEKQPHLYSLVPYLLQVLTLSIFVQPVSIEYITSNVVTVVVSSLVALSVYVFASGNTEKSNARKYLQKGAVVTAYFAPFLYMITRDDAWYLPLSLSVAGAITLHYLRRSSQAKKEVATTVIVVGIMGIVAALGATDILLHTHIVAVMFGGFAYWRSTLDDEKTTREYLYAMFFTATIPLILQVLSGVAGDMYGWLLLLEQVVFMILGISINRRFLTTWGLYTAVAAVLFQLRHLGWAALLVLAIFIISIAIRRLARLTKS